MKRFFSIIIRNIKWIIEDLVEWLLYVLFFIFYIIDEKLDMADIDDFLNKYIDDVYVDDTRSNYVIERFLFVPKLIDKHFKWLLIRKILKEPSYIMLKNGKRINIDFTTEWVDCKHSCKKCIIQAICDGKNIIKEPIKE